MTPGFVAAQLGLGDRFQDVGTYAGLASVLGLAVLALLFFAQARELKRLREWAAGAPQRDAELVARTIADVQRRMAPAPKPSPTPGATQVVAPGAATPGAPASSPPGQPQPVPATGGAPASAPAGAPTSPGAKPGAPASAPAAPTSTPAPGSAPAPAAPTSTPAPGSAPAPAATPAEAPETPAPAKPGTPAPPKPGVPAAVPAAATAAAAAGVAKAPASTPAPTGGAVSADTTPSGGTTPAGRPPAVPPRPTGPFPGAPGASNGATGRSAPLRMPPTSAALPRPGREAGRRSKLPLIGAAVAALVALVVAGVLVIGGGDDPQPASNQIGEQPAAQPTPTTGGGAGAGEPLDRGSVPVAVFNGTTFNGLAREASDVLERRGYSVPITETDETDQSRQATQVFYADGRRRYGLDVARLLEVPASAVQAMDDTTRTLAAGNQVLVLIGADKAQ